MVEPVKSENDQNDSPKQATTLIYMPFAHDPDETVVDGIMFRAYEPIDIGEHKAGLAAKLAGNPWFSAGKADEERKTAWAAARKVEQEAAAAVDAAAKAQADPAAEAARATAHIDKLRTPPAGDAIVVDKAPVEVKLDADEPMPKAVEKPEAEAKPETETKKTKKDKE
jgi:hypothetical protein